jgi:hypothetical protein
MRRGRGHEPQEDLRARSIDDDLDRSPSGSALAHDVELGPRRRARSELLSRDSTAAVEGDLQVTREAASRQRSATARRAEPTSPRARASLRGARGAAARAAERAWHLAADGQLFRARVLDARGGAAARFVARAAGEATGGDCATNRPSPARAGRAGVALERATHTLGHAAVANARQHDAPALGAERVGVRRRRARNARVVFAIRERRAVLVSHAVAGGSLPDLEDAAAAITFENTAVGAWHGAKQTFPEAARRALLHPRDSFLTGLHRWYVRSGVRGRGVDARVERGRVEACVEPRRIEAPIDREEHVA